jgi:hypothetical protein
MSPPLQQHTDSLGSFQGSVLLSTEVFLLVETIAIICTEFQSVAMPQHATINNDDMCCTLDIITCLLLLIPTSARHILIRVFIAQAARQNLYERQPLIKFELWAGELWIWLSSCFLVCVHECIACCGQGPCIFVL